MQLDFSDYRPNDVVLSTLKQVRFVGVVGPTAVGKSTVVKQARELDPSIHIVLSTVSRVPREGERDGVDYHFRSREEMLHRIEKREFVQVPPSLLGDIYATAPEDYTTHGTSVLAVIADAIPTFRALPFQNNCTIFVLPPDYASWQERIGHHNFTPEQLEKRLQEAARSFKFACEDEQAFFVLNDDLDVAAEEFVALIHGEQPDAEQQHACRELARSLYEQLRTALTDKQIA